MLSALVCRIVCGGPRSLASDRWLAGLRRHEEEGTLTFGGLVGRKGDTGAAFAPCRAEGVAHGSDLTRRASGGGHDEDVRLAGAI